MEAIESRVGEPTNDESVLVGAARKGDMAAFEELVRRYDRNVFRIAQHITQNREDAEDVVQEAFLKAFNNAYEQYHHDESRAFAVAHHAAKQAGERRGPG